MEFDNSWSALSRPGEASDYFDLEIPEGINVNTAEYSPANAWWLAELSRLIYRADGEATEREGPGGKVSNCKDILAQVNLHELFSFSDRGILGSVIVPEETGRDQFAVLVFRGTTSLRNWLQNLQSLRRNWPQGGLVHRGFDAALYYVWERLSSQLGSIRGPLFYTGHSLGGALATLAASLKPPHAVYTFGSPRVGDAEFVDHLRDVCIYRVVNHADLCTRVPLSSRPMSFRHSGELHYIGRDNRVVVQPDAAHLAADRRKRRPSSDPVAKRRWSDPPECLADHAPVNYVAHLERQLERR